MEELQRVALTYPAIDNHAHALLRANYRDHLDFDGVISEAQGDALKDAVHTLACYRAKHQLADRLKLPPSSSWEDVKSKRSELEYLDLCKLFLEPTGIQCILIDDGINVGSKLYDIPWHDQFTSSPSRQIVRVETVAEEIVEKHLKLLSDSDMSLASFVALFAEGFRQALLSHVSDPRVVGFKSAICYRTGLAVAENKPSELDICFSNALLAIQDTYKTEGKVRLNQKILNDLVVHMTLEIASQHKKPVQFHTGLGDNDLSLTLASPAHLQPLFSTYPDAVFVLLHSSYPYTREAGYLSAMYPNVFLDFGEVFPLVSDEGQRRIIRQMLEITPLNKLMWSTDAHFWPESYYLSAIQSRMALHKVLLESVHAFELSEIEAITFLKNALFHTANRVYHLGLSPNFEEPPP